ncbi:MAG: hypothetical protein IJ498_08710, partial [Akkermansia sp.]|nr:hypothetical protein [Akkermansia sp.]
PRQRTGRGWSSSKQLDALEDDFKDVPDNREDCDYLDGGGFVVHFFEKPHPLGGIAARGGGLECSR